MNMFEAEIDRLLDSAPPEVVAVFTSAGKVMETFLNDSARLVRSFNDYLSSLESTESFWGGFCLAILLIALANWYQRVRREIQASGSLLQYSLKVLKRLPIIRWIVKREMDKEIQKMRKSMKKEADPSLFREMPPKGLTESEVFDLVERRQRKDITPDRKGGLEGVSGTVYNEPDHQDFLSRVYTKFAHTNPLHGDVFPSVARMEAEVVSMTASILGGGPRGSVPSVCGTMTSGGTESILTAVKAARDYAIKVLGIREPEMIIGRSAHPAFIKAAEYFQVRLRVVEVGRDYRVHAKDIKAALSPRTALLVASAPSFPHGVIDDCLEIARLAKSRGILCHVDCCLGGYVLPFARDLGYPIRPFDFSVPGVTSISVDTHKFGKSHKGTSVVLYRSPEIRKFQFTAVTDWSGGLYISPGFAGSRSGALIATAWASLISNGLEGYRESTRVLMRAAEHFVRGLKEIPELEVVGRPDICIVAFKSAPQYARRLNIFELNDWLTGRGWHLNALQFPSALHFAFTMRSASCVPRLLEDLKLGCRLLLDPLAKVKEDGQANGAPGAAEGGSDSKKMAGVYGSAIAMPDRGIVGDVLCAVQDLMLEL